MEKTEGITLKSIEFREHQRIITVMTKDHGIISLIASRLGSKNYRLLNLTSPLTCGEFVFKPGKTDLWRFIDGSILDLHAPIRQELGKLQAAQSMLKRMHTTQLPQKPAPALYQLLKSFLSRLKTTTVPETLLTAFTLKFLRHEGLLSIKTTCGHCAAPDSFRFHEGDNYCAACAPFGSIALTPDEWQQMIHLLASRSFEALESLPINDQIKRLC
ncbi:MAG: DNA repair protein RecO [Chlamydiales bacterium]|nr:DNA repair protein RecO [Chlamydiales bacterium]